MLDLADHGLGHAAQQHLEPLVVIDERGVLAQDMERRQEHLPNELLPASLGKFDIVEPGDKGQQNLAAAALLAQCLRVRGEVVDADLDDRADHPLDRRVCSKTLLELLEAMQLRDGVRGLG
ncbi:MAG: hypothetical protein JRS35_21120 [Deltaproteobacteria bacterium]|nr:hypothetical protein [Deltaproteobacteria bacterium]